jgi:hypothetical protein
MSRTILVTISQHEPIIPKVAQVERYLYGNYEIAEYTIDPESSTGAIRIVGDDVAGFTAEALVERLASGLHFGEIQ